MANIKSQIKDIKQNEVRRQRNIATRSAIKTHTKKALDTAGTPEGQENLNLAFRAIDRAVSKNVLKKNTAARKKSVLIKSVSSK